MRFVLVVFFAACSRGPAISPPIVLHTHAAPDAGHPRYEYTFDDDPLSSNADPSGATR